MKYEVEIEDVNSNPVTIILGYDYNGEQLCVPIKLRADEYEKFITDSIYREKLMRKAIDTLVLRLKENRLIAIKELEKIAIKELEQLGVNKETIDELISRYIGEDNG
jgi:DNA polymerase III delta subunit